MTNNRYNTKLNMLLMSAGPTTKLIQRHLYALGTRDGKVSEPTIVRIADGWTHFKPEDHVSPLDYTKQVAEAAMARMWSRKYLEYVFGNVAVKTIYAGELGKNEFRDEISRSDLLFVPGGNTYQTMRGLQKHKATIQNYVNNGLPYAGESAGAIVAGVTTLTASLEPADIKPKNTTENIEDGLGLINAAIAVHKSGGNENFNIPGLHSTLANFVLQKHETPRDVIDEFAGTMYSRQDIETYPLNDAQAILIEHGDADLLGNERLLEHLHHMSSRI